MNLTNDLPEYYQVVCRPLLIFKMATGMHRFELLTKRRDDGRLAVYLYSAEHNPSFRISALLATVQLRRSEFVFISSDFDAIRKALGKAGFIKTVGEVRTFKSEVLPICRFSSAYLRHHLNEAPRHAVSDMIRHIKEFVRQKVSP